jgi:hypothetical protein
MRKERIPDLIAEIRDEMANLKRLIGEIGYVYHERPASERKRRVYHESLALKLHNFYTGCERIFQKIADDLNGGIPTSHEWHKRLLSGMALEIEGSRPNVITKRTAVELEEYLAFRHVVRNIYGFELDPERISRLVERVGEVFQHFEKEFDKFISFLVAVSKK